MFGMNPVQLEKLVRTVLTVGGTIATTFGWLTTGQVDGITATALQVLGPLTTVGTFIWSMIAGMQSSQLTAAATIPAVKAVQLNDTIDGRALAAATPPNVMVSSPANLGSQQSMRK